MIFFFLNLNLSLWLSVKTVLNAFTIAKVIFLAITGKKVVRKQLQVKEKNMFH